jgi:hypothetical protein
MAAAPAEGNAFHHSILRTAEIGDAASKQRGDCGCADHNELGMQDVGRA